MTPQLLPLASLPEIVRSAVGVMTARVVERSRRNADEARRLVPSADTYPAVHGTHRTQEVGLGRTGRLGKHDW